MAKTRLLTYVLGLLLCISLLLFVSKGLFIINPLPSPVIISSYKSGRRVFVVKKFEFTPFLKDLDRENHRKVSPPTRDYEIDQRYGVEKRLVPSGPNPLHH
ncbi:unnamed protein product [Cochlearia groenlandica]